MAKWNSKRNGAFSHSPSKHHPGCGQAYTWSSFKMGGEAAPWECAVTVKLCYMCVHDAVVMQES